MSTFRRATAGAAIVAASAQPRGQPPQMDPSKGGDQANGITETLLSGDTATKVTAGRPWA